MNGIYGINLMGLKKLSLDMISYQEEFKKIFSEINNIVLDSKSYFIGEAGDVFRKNFNDFSANFRIVTNSMQIYSDDFLQVIKNYKKNDEQQQNIF